MFLRLEDTYNAGLFSGGVSKPLPIATKLVSAEDGRAGRFLTATPPRAESGSIEEALRIFSDVRSRYPSVPGRYGASHGFITTGENTGRLLM